MDEEAGKPKPNVVDSKLKEALNDELTSFMNPKIGRGTLGNIPQTVPVPTQSYPNFDNVENEISSQIQKKPVVRTYKSDVEETIQSGHLSSINIALSQNRRMMEGAMAPAESKKKSKINLNILILSLVLIVGGVSAVFVPYFLVQNQNAPTPILQTNTSLQNIMTVDVEEKINTRDINLNRVNSTLKERVQQSNTSLGQIKNIFLTEGDGVDETTITSDKFLSLIKADVPSEISRALKPEYMFGLHNFNGNQEFLILRVDSYDTAFSGMLSWETDLWQNFKEIFDLQSKDTTTSTNYSSTTENFGVEIKRFQDATFFNKDSRVVRDSAGKIIFLYSIVNENTIVITTSIDTLKEIISRITKANIITQ